MGQSVVLWFHTIFGDRATLVLPKGVMSKLNIDEEVREKGAYKLEYYM